MSGRLSLRFVHTIADRERVIEAAGPRGVAIEVSSWVYRFAAYCHSLSRKVLAIVTMREEHPSGWHGRRTLLDRVRLLADPDGETA